MKLYTFGCCAGTEPMENLHHTALAFEVGDTLYWFDAGESCSRTAHLMGIDLLKIKSIFISHTHMDHIGGLGNLLWNMRKVSGRRNTLPYSKSVDVYIPCMESWDGVWKILTNAENRFKWDCPVTAHPVFEGELYSDENLTITALHNNHLINFEENGEKLSFSYKIKAEGKTVVFSGDLKHVSDLDPFLEEECDYLLIETGHHTVEDVCRYVNGKKVKNLMFVHHCRDIIANINQARLEAQKFSNCNVVFCEDKAVFEL